MTVCKSIETQKNIFQAVLEATWPSDMTNSSQLMWNKLRNVIVGAALFKKAGIRSARKRLCSSSDIISSDDKSLSMAHAISRSSLDSTHSQDTEGIHGICKYKISINLFP